MRLTRHDVCAPCGKPRGIFSRQQFAGEYLHQQPNMLRPVNNAARAMRRARISCEAVGLAQQRLESLEDLASLKTSDE